MQERGAVKKSEMDDLFRRIGELYEQHRRPAVDCVLPFPHLQIAQARVWRGLPPADVNDLDGALAAVGKLGMPPLEAAALVALTEALFRPMRAVELELEGHLPDVLSGFTPAKGLLSDPSDRLARTEFSRTWETVRAEVGDAWVLAATRRPLLVRGRPPVVAPKVAAATVVERLLREGRSEGSALGSAGDVAAALLDQPVREAEVDGWRREYRRVTVPVIGSDPLPLTLYLADLFRAVVEGRPCWTAETLLLRSLHLTPTDFLTGWHLPIATCAQIAGLVARFSFAEGGERLDGQSIDLAACWLCDSEEVSGAEIWSHLRQAHGLREDEYEVPVSSRGRSRGALMSLVRRKTTRQVLASFRIGPARHDWALPGASSRAR